MIWFDIVWRDPICYMMCLSWVDMTWFDLNRVRVSFVPFPKFVRWYYYPYTQTKLTLYILLNTYGYTVLDTLYNFEYYFGRTTLVSLFWKCIILICYFGNYFGTCYFGNTILIICLSSKTLSLLTTLNLISWQFLFDELWN